MKSQIIYFCNLFDVRGNALEVCILHIQGHKQNILESKDCQSVFKKSF